MQTPTVSIIIPTYNRADLLKICLDSVVKQTYPHWEALIVDNLSTDNIEAVANAYNDPRMKVIKHTANRVIGSVRNTGAQHSNADLLAFLDSDDLWEANKLELVIRAFNENPAIDVVCHDEWAFGEGQAKRLLRYGPHSSYYDLLFKGNCLSTSAVTVKRAAFVAVNGFSEDPNILGIEDYDLWLRLAKSNNRFLFLHEVLGWYREHGSSFTAQIEKRINFTINTLDIYFTAWQPKDLKHTLLMNKRYAEVYRSAGRPFMQCGEHANARKYLVKALKKNPFDWKALILLAANELRLKKI